MNDTNYKALRVKKASGIRLGSYKTKEGWQFGIFRNDKELEICIFSKNNPDIKEWIKITEEYRIGKVFSFILEGSLDGMCYGIGREGMADPYAKSYIYIDEQKRMKKSMKNKKADMSSENYRTFGKDRRLLKSYLSYSEFDWQNDSFPFIKNEDMLIYKLHIKSYTFKDNVANPGTYKAVMKKIPYIKELGMTSVLLMPSYEFHDTNIKKEDRYNTTYTATSKINYWGYTNGYYYSPKILYSSNEDIISEFKEMVRAFHKNDMEVLMEFYFPDNMSVSVIVDILRYWHSEYHVDGFRVICSDGALYAIQTDLSLLNCKLLARNFGGSVFDIGNDDFTHSSNNRLIWYDDGFMEAGRHFLRGDEESIVPFAEKIIRKQYGYPTVNFMADHDGMTLMDMVSYERRHNEINGENNHDGRMRNISFNCGIEGETNDVAIVKNRHKMIKNAFTMVMMSASIPMLMAGDEFGRSQKGNNNPYCHDSEINYVDWTLLEKNADIFEFVKSLIEIRKNHKSIRPEREFLLNDHLNVGMPDLSYHSERAWYPLMEEYSKYIGMFYCGAYAGETKNVYVLYNMHKEVHEFALPVRGSAVWKLMAASDDNSVFYKSGDKRIRLEGGTSAVFVYETSTSNIN